MRVCRDTTGLVKIGGQYQTFTWRAKYIYIVYSSTNYFAAWQQCRGNLALCSDGSTKRFRIFRGYMSVINSAKGLLPSTASVFTWTPPPLSPTFTLYEICLSFLITRATPGLSERCLSHGNLQMQKVHSIEWEDIMWHYEIRVFCSYFRCRTAG